MGSSSSRDIVDAGHDCGNALDCDDGRPCSHDYCDVDHRCQHIAVTGLCRAPADLCDAPERCDGETLDCPTDEAIPAGTPCRAAVDLCDAPETCDGTGFACPADILLQAMATCRAPVDACHDEARFCTGISAVCPPGPEDAGPPCAAENRCWPATCDLATGCAYAPDDAELARVLVGVSAGEPVVTVPIPRFIASRDGINFIFCPAGPTETTCQVEVDFAAATLATSRTDMGDIRVTGTVPIRMASLPSAYEAPPLGPINTRFVVTGNDACSVASQTFVRTDLDLRVRLVDPPGGTIRSYESFGTTSILDNIAACTASSTVVQAAQTAIANAISSRLAQALVPRVNAQLCVLPTSAEPPCPPPSVPDDGGVCAVAGGCLSLHALEGPPGSPGCASPP